MPAFSRGVPASAVPAALPWVFRHTWRVLGLALSLAAASGCAMGPKWYSQVEVPKPASPVAFNKVIVSNFLASSRGVSVTFSNNIRTTMESLSAHDVSAQVVAGLVAKGVPAEARADFSPKLLRPGELLVRGAVSANDKYVNWALQTPAIIISSCTLLIIGGILPCPVPFEEGATCKYRVEAIDADSRVVVQTGEQEIIGSYKDLYMWGPPAEGYNSMLVKELTPQVIAAIAAAVGQPSAAPATNAANAANTANTPGAAPAAAGSTPPDLAEAVVLLAKSKAAFNQQKYDAAADTADKALALAEAKIRKDTLDLEPFLMASASAHTMRSLGDGQTKKSNPDELELSKSLYLRAFDIRRTYLGAADPETVKLREFILTTFGADAIK
jgi:hypothetical protein